MDITITELPMTKARVAEMGLGCGLADIHEVVLDLDEAKGRHRLMSLEQHPTDDMMLLTRWMPTAV